ncbi:MAG: electron transfer flavoprotein subunit alpha/FixB family protein [Steroidobacteraceae bacterium]|jgi:electron transfer flavoprotein alpha subunit|nr:electron transfer flavoprotein subunit alpha/FixB family protein [Steroidobacteraceae bacterium]
MATVLIVGEHDGSKLNPSTARCVTCAAQISGAEVHVALFGADLAAVAPQAAALKGVTKVLSVANPANAHPLAAVLAPQVVALAGPYTHVLGPSTTFGKDLMPRVAALLGVPQVSDAMSVDGPYKFKRPTYAGNAIVTVEAPESRKLVATVRTASFEAAPQGGQAAVEAVAVSVPLPTHTRFVSVSAANSDRPDLQTAAKVVSGGRALGSKENFQLIYSLADRMGAAVGASRAAVDAGYASNELQVGQTGKIIAPELYVAIGISGAIQHLTGIKDARTIVAINKDAEAPIFEIADYGLVGDLFQILPELEKSLA